MNNFTGPSTFTGSHPIEDLELHLNLITKISTASKILSIRPNTSTMMHKGTFDALSNRNTLRGYGTVPVMKEFGPHNDSYVRMTIRYDFNDSPGTGAQSYRIYRQE